MAPVDTAIPFFSGMPRFAQFDSRKRRDSIGPPGMFAGVSRPTLTPSIIVSQRQSV